MARTTVLLLTLLLLLSTRKAAAEETLSLDTVTAARPARAHMSFLRRLIRGFDRLDKRYIEPQHYFFTAMLQVTNTYDIYTLSGTNGETQSISFAPDLSAKVGPFLGWRWLFLGYTFDVRNLNIGKQRLELDLSLYSSQIGLDLYYRRTGRDYKVREVSLGSSDINSRLEDVSFDGIKSGVTGGNIYYIFNHGRFSYPAAFAQSTIQKISCGSWMAGIGFTTNHLEFDHERFQRLIDERVGENVVELDSGLMFRTLNYYNVNASVGYAYNWVFARQWLLSIGGHMALAYKRSTGDIIDGDERDFTLDHINLDGIGRFGLVYNTMRWYAGMSAYVHSNNFRQSRFSTNNTFGSANVYVGYNFGLKKKYKK